MSRHDAVLTRAETYHPDVFGGALIADLVKALKEEINAHDVTRAFRNDLSDSVSALRGNVRGLESKVQLLQKELDDLKNARTNLGATLYHDGYTHGLVVARQAIEALEDD